MEDFDLERSQLSDDTVASSVISSITTPKDNEKSHKDSHYSWNINQNIKTKVQANSIPLDFEWPPPPSLFNFSSASLSISK